MIIRSNFTKNLMAESQQERNALLSDAQSKPFHIKLQFIASAYLSMLLASLYPSHLERHPINGSDFRRVNNRHKTMSLIAADRVASGRIDVDPTRWGFK